MSGQRASVGAERRQEGLLPHLFVGAMACLLTVSIAGSGLYFAARWREKQQERARIEAFVDGLSQRSAAELAETVRQLRVKPALAARVLPVVLLRLKAAGSGTDGLGVVRVAAAFAAEEPAVAAALFAARRSVNEAVAAEAVAAMAEIRPVDVAAERLGVCIEDAACPAVVDVACEGLLDLGAAGRAEMKRRLGSLSVDRRHWLVGLIAARRPVEVTEWLGMLTADDARDVADRARATLKEVMMSGP